MTRSTRPRDNAFDDAPAPALQRLMGRAPVLSAVALVALYGWIGVHTGIGAFNFQPGGLIGRIGAVICWSGIMVLLAGLCWALWISGRLRWLKGRIQSFGVSEEDRQAETKTITSAAAMVRISRRLRPMIEILLRLGIAAGVFGLGLLVIGLLQQPG